MGRASFNGRLSAPRLGSIALTVRSEESQPSLWRVVSRERSHFELATQDDARG